MPREEQNQQRSVGIHGAGKRHKLDTTLVIIKHMRKPLLTFQKETQVTAMKDVTSSVSIVRNASRGLCRTEERKRNSAAKNLSDQQPIAQYTVV